MHLYSQDCPWSSDLSQSQNLVNVSSNKEKKTIKKYITDNIGQLLHKDVRFLYTK